MILFSLDLLYGPRNVVVWTSRMLLDPNQALTGLIFQQY